MWSDPQFDLEDLEARLYSQVHHSGETEESPLPATATSSTSQEDSSRRFQRYFERCRSPYVYPNFQPHNNFESNIPQHIATERRYNNFYKRLGLFTFPDLVINPAVNNIVLVPTPPTPLSAENAFKKWNRLEKKRMKYREKRAAKRRERKKKEFKEHRLKKKIEDESLKSDNDEGVKASNLPAEVICLSDSEVSVCEVVETSNVAVVVVSSDDDDDKDKIDNQETSIKADTISEIAEVSNNHDHKNVNKTEPNTGISIPESSVDVNINDNSHTSEDDEVIFIKPPGHDEIINLSCEDEESQAEIDVENNSSDPGNNELDTPESTNDFLDNNLSLSHNNIDVDSDGNDISCSSALQPRPDVYETESSCSASDFGVSSRSAIFAEQEFDGATKELNLDSFTDYIASEGQTSSRISSILTCTKKFAGSSAGGAPKIGKRRHVRYNSSDSSSESDYEENKVALVKGKKNIESMPGSDTDDCIIDVGAKGDSENIEHKLPNLSPITTDEEIDVTSIDDSNKKQKKKQRKSKNNMENQQGKAENVFISGQKRKSDENHTETLEPKRMKQIENYESVQPQTVDTADRFFSSSDECSEVEIEDDKNSSYDLSTIELVNIETSTPTKIPQEKSNDDKSKSFMDYWTDDMQKFYSESWGHENFSVKEAQKSMSDDPKLWKTIDRDRINVNLGPRGPRCRRCRELGHKAMHCIKDLGPPKCILCGRNGHFDARCPNKMCTSCGRRSQYSTTYCSKCAKSRHAMCYICSMRGHTATYCTDTWRRYHLTTKAGPLKQPSDPRLKSRKNRWCSGCASRGHFEYDCNYYNRTHAPTNPFVHSYEDAYADNNSTKRQEQNHSTNIQVINPLQLNPVQPNSHSLQSYPHDQHFPSNFVQNPLGHGGLNPNFYQQFPIFQSLPNNFSLQQDSNVLQQQAREDSKHVQDNGETSGGNTEVNLSSRIDKPETQTSSASPRTNSENEVSKSLILKFVEAKKLLTKEGESFLHDLRKDTNLKIGLVRQRKCYLCTLKGPGEQILEAKDKILKFYTPVRMHHNYLLQLFQGTDFNMNVLQACILKLKDPKIQWATPTRALLQRIKELQTVITNVQDNLRMIDELKSCYVALNAVLLGKIGILDGAKHMRILEKWKYKSEGALRVSYDYIFKSCYQLNNVNYKRTVNQLYCAPVVKSDIEKLFESGVRICQMNNSDRLLRLLKYAFKQVVETSYSQKYVDRFKNLRKQIKQRVPK